ncbi:hypothetical protein D3C77_517570 [compost metagenome]
MLGHDVERVLRRNEPAPQRLFLLNTLHQTVDARVLVIEHDMRLDLEHIGCLQHADGGADDVKIRQAVPHNNDLIALLHQIAESMGDDARPHARPLLYGAGLAAIEGQPLTGLHGGLVPPAPERHIQTRLGEFAQLAEALGAKTKADAQRHRHLQIRGHLADLIQDNEPALLQFVQRFLIQHHQITLGGQSSQIDSILLRPFG